MSERPPDVTLLDEFLAGVESGRTAFTADVIEEVAHALESTPGLMREILHRRMWKEARRFFDECLAGGLTTRPAADATVRRLAALGFKARSENHIRQTLLRQRIEERAAGMAEAHGAHTTGDHDTCAQEVESS